MYLHYWDQPHPSPNIIDINEYSFGHSTCRPYLSIYHLQYHNLFQKCRKFLIILKNIQGCKRPMTRSKEKLCKIQRKKVKFFIFARKNFEKQGNRLKGGTFTALKTELSEKELSNFISHNIIECTFFVLYRKLVLYRLRWRLG